MFALWKCWVHKFAAFGLFAEMRRVNIEIFIKCLLESVVIPQVGQYNEVPDALQIDHHHINAPFPPPMF